MIPLAPPLQEGMGEAFLVPQCAVPAPLLQEGMGGASLAPQGAAPAPPQGAALAPPLHTRHMPPPAVHQATMATRTHLAAEANASLSSAVA